MQSSLSSTSNRSTKRYSNNLFGSGRFNDYNYVRSVTKSSRMSSSTPSKSNSNYQNDNPDSLRPSTPESRRATSVHSQSNSIDSSDSSVRSAPLMAPTPYGEQQQHLVSVAEYRISKALGPSALKRASMALEAAIKEFEEEAEEILMPRTRMSAQSSQPSEPAVRVLSALSHDSPLMKSNFDRELPYISRRSLSQSWQSPQIINWRAIQSTDTLHLYPRARCQGMSPACRGL